MEQRCSVGTVVGARVICCYAVQVTLSRTPSWNGWHNIHRAEHHPNLLEPGTVLLVNRVPHFLQRCGDNIDIPYCLHNIYWLCLEATSEGSQVPQTLVGDDQRRYEIGCSDGQQQTTSSATDRIRNYWKYA